MFSLNLLSSRIRRNPIHLAISFLVGFSVFVLYTIFVPPLVKAQASVEGQPSAQTSFPATSTLCASVNTIPVTECDALVALYTLQSQIDVEQKLLQAAEAQYAANLKRREDLSDRLVRLHPWAFLVPSS